MGKPTAQPQYSSQPPYGAPPQYSATPQYSTTSQHSQYQALPGYATSPNPSYGQPQPQSRVLHIYREGITHRHARIVDSDKQTQLYRVDMNSGGCFSSKPHLKIYASATGNQVGTVTFHTWSSSMDLTIQGRPVLLKKSGFMTSAHEFNSIATGGSFKWKKDGMFSGGNLLCLDQQDQLIARFRICNWAMSKEGKFELSPGVNGMLMDEIVTSGIAMVEWARRQRNAAASASAGGGAAAS
ncbi:hypothetical protein ACLMJK_002256 [Lecanora helva]